MSFRLVEVDNQGFKIFDEEGNAVESVVDSSGTIRLAVDSHAKIRGTDGDVARTVPSVRALPWDADSDGTLVVVDQEATAQLKAINDKLETLIALMGHVASE